MTENNPLIELIHSEPDEVLQKRVTRIMMDARMLTMLSKPQARAIYTEIELARDALSRILDKVDGKS